VAISKLLESAWLSRAWVFQEVVLSKKATFLFRDVTLPFLALVWISRTIAGSQPLTGTTTYQDDRSNPAQDSPPPISDYDITSTRGYHTLSVMHRSWHAVSSTKYLSFLWVLSEVSPLLQTTDRRDSVYAFLGLQVVQYSTTVIKADYVSTYEDTLINTAISIIQKTNSLEILSYCERESSGGLQLSGRLPS
jgi:hypothetical protein